MDNDDSLVTVPQVASFFEVTPVTVRVWIRRGDLRAYKAGNSWYVKFSDLREFTERRFGLDTQ